MPFLKVRTTQNLKKLSQSPQSLKQLNESIKIFLNKILYEHQ